MSGSKRINASNTVGATSSVKSSSNIQVIGKIGTPLSGKIVTPQSLLPRKTSSKDGGKKYGNKKASTNPGEDTITELVELPEKGGKLISAMSSKELLGGADKFAIRRMTRNEMASEKHLEEKVIVTLSETFTETLFFSPSLVMSNETREVVALEEKNVRYEALIDSHKNSDGFSSRQTQTLNNFQKNQNDQAAPNASQDFGCLAVSYEITDTLSGKKTSTETDTFTSTTEDSNDPRAVGLSPQVAIFVQDTVGVAIATHGCLLNVDDLTRPADPQEAVRKEPGRVGGGGRSQRVSVGVGGVGSSRAFAAGNSQTDDVSSSRPSNSVTGDDSEDEPHSRQVSYGGDDHGAGGGQGAEAPDGQQLLRERQAAAIMESKSLLKKLQLTERTVLQNIYHRQHLDYRDLPDVNPLILTSKNDVQVIDSTDQLFGGLGLGLMSLGVGIGGISGSTAQLGKTAGNSSSKHKQMDDADGTDSDTVVSQDKASPDLRKLFSYHAESVVRGRPVTAMAWNSANADLLAVGYGRVDFSLDGGQKPARGMAVDEELAGGLVLFWSIRNPEHPEKVLRTAHPVTALDFSRRSPTLLALGLYNGDIDVYDVRRESDWGKPVQSSGGMDGGHTDPVWQVRWITKGQEGGETLVSISTDGRVLEWNLKKGLVVTTLMALKRGGVGEGWISRQAAGLGFDFVPGDSTTYVVGTEEGQVHRCSVSYNEQYLDTYESHNGPVYRVRFSTRWPDVFVSCSADWTVGLYHIRSSAGRGPLLRLHCTGQDFGISDVTWCPGNSTVLAAVTNDAKLQIWDLDVSAIDPVINFDTNLDAEPDSADFGHTTSSKPGSPSTKPGSPEMLFGSTGLLHKKSTNTTLGQSRRDDRDASEKETPVTKLLQSLAQSGNRRSLTCVLFGERSPIVVVGDNRGVVTVYRVMHPVLFTHQGPVQQMDRLREAILRQSDPMDAAKLSAGGAANGSVEPSNN